METNLHGRADRTFPSRGMDARSYGTDTAQEEPKAPLFCHDNSPVKSTCNRVVSLSNSSQLNRRPLSAASRPRIVASVLFTEDSTVGLV